MNTKNLITKKENLLKSIEEIKQAYGNNADVLVGMVSEIFVEWSFAVQTLEEIDNEIFDFQQKTSTLIDENTLSLFTKISKKIEEAPGNGSIGYKTAKWFQLSLIEDLVKQAASLCGYYTIQEKINLESFTTND